MNEEIFPPTLFDSFGEIGIEEEFYLVDNETFKPIEKPKKFFQTLPKELKNNLDVELFEFVIEAWIEKSKTIKKAKEEIKNKRKALKKHAKKFGYSILGAGTHPNMNWKIYENTKKPNYLSQLKRIQYPQKRNTTAGLHVHVGMDSKDKAIWVANEIRKYMPLFLAISANSPYWQGMDTGLSSSRALVFENLPNTGIPPYFDSIDEYRDLMKKYLKSGFIEEIGEVWWDVRINNDYGSLEIRAPDSQKEVQKTITLMKLIYELINQLSDKYERGETNSKPKKELISQNKWQAIRYGDEAEFIFQDETKDVNDLLNKIIDETRLNKKDLKPLKPTGSEEQRKNYANGGIIKVLEDLVI